MIRDRLIAIGMRRPMRIRTEEHDVPVPTLEDLELTASPTQMRSVPSDCPVATDSNLRRLLGSMFVEKAKFCSCISNVLSNYACAQQSLNEGGNARVTGTLIPKADLDPSAIRDCHDELSNWFRGLPEIARLPDSRNYLAQETAPLILHRALLHLVYYMTLSTLHRPYSKCDTTYPMSTGEALTPREFVRHAAFRITDIMQGLLVLDYQRFLPTTGITVLQPALISHLLDIKSPDAQVRVDGLRGFCHCVQVLCRLRDCYAAADFALVMISAAVRKAQIDTSIWFSESPPEYNILPNGGNVEVPDGQSRKAQNIEDLVDAGIRNRLVTPANTLTTGSPLPTPPSEASDALPDDVVAKRLAMYLSPASIPSSSSDSEEQSSPTSATSDQAPSAMKQSVQYPPNDSTSHFPVQTLMPALTPRDLVGDFETPFNMNDMTDAGLYFGHGPGVMHGGFGGPPGLGMYAGGIQGESSGFWMDLDWIGGVPQQQAHHSHLPTGPHPHAPQ